MLVAKEDGVFLVTDDGGQVDGEDQGVFRFDTRYLKTWRWTVQNSQTLSVQPLDDGLLMHVAAVDRRRVQQVGLERRVRVSSQGLVDSWILTNTSRTDQTLEIALSIEGEFKDIMARWMPTSNEVEPTTAIVESREGCLLTKTAIDGVEMRVDIKFETSARADSAALRRWVFKIPQGGTASLTARVILSASNHQEDSRSISRPLPSYDAWRSAFGIQLGHRHKPAYDRAVDDLRMLLLATEQGAYPAAGAPWFIAMFGRDALITAHMLLERKPELALSVLKALAARQGVRDDPYTEEAPGKILHEIRLGELSRSRRIPFGCYFGSIDATPLFVMLLDAYVSTTGDVSAARDLTPAWTGAIDFILRHEDADGLLSFDPSGSGLGVQSWKDSPDSMSHADGSPAVPPLAVVEVQAYAAAAFEAAGRLYEFINNPAAAKASRQRANRLKAIIHDRYWMEDLGTYAMALDMAGAPLRVLSSDAGHLLWCGVARSDVAPRLMRTLMGEAMFSGWGLRTLGAGETCYNPVSYHNGAVWPHDTAMFAGGLRRYGFLDEARYVASGLFDLAASQPMQRMPEVISGYARKDRLGPIPYTHSCRPQAWSAAGLIYLAPLLENSL